MAVASNQCFESTHISQYYLDEIYMKYMCSISSLAPIQETKYFRKATMCLAAPHHHPQTCTVHKFWVFNDIGISIIKY